MTGKGRRDPKRRSRERQGESMSDTERKAGAKSSRPFDLQTLAQDVVSQVGVEIDFGMKLDRVALSKRINDGSINGRSTAGADFR